MYRSIYVYVCVSSKFISYKYVFHVLIYYMYRTVCAKIRTGLNMIFLATSDDPYFGSLPPAFIGHWESEDVAIGFWLQPVKHLKVFLYISPTADGCQRK